MTTNILFIKIFDNDSYKLNPAIMTYLTYGYTFEGELITDRLNKIIVLKKYEVTYKELMVINLCSDDNILYITNLDYSNGKYKYMDIKTYSIGFNTLVIYKYSNDINNYKIGPRKEPSIDVSESMCEISHMPKNGTLQQAIPVDTTSLQFPIAEVLPLPSAPPTDQTEK